MPYRKLGERWQGLGQRLGSPLGGKQSYAQRLFDLYSANIAFNFPLNDTSGVTAVETVAGANGTYNATGVTLNQTGFRGTRAALFDGADGYVTISSAGLKSLIDTQEFTIMGISKAYESASWTSGDTFGDWVFINVNASNRFKIGRYGLAGELCGFNTLMGGTQKIIIYNSDGLGTDFFHWAYTVSASGDLVRAYINGSPVSAGLGGLGIWAAGATTSLINYNLSGWYGYQQDITFLNRPLTAAEVAAATAGFF